MPRNAVERLAAASRDSHLALRRVERQQRLVERLVRASRAVPSDRLAAELGVSRRTIERDLARLRDAGVPIESTPGPAGGSRLEGRATARPVELTTAEIAALIASLTALGPTATESASSAMAALVRAIEP